MRLTTTALTTCLLASQLIGCSESSNAPAQTSEQQAAIKVASVEVKKQSIPQYYPLTATLEAVNESTVSAQTSGVIEAILVDVNDNVKAGDVIARIKNTEQKAALAQAKASADEAAKMMERGKTLREQGTISQGEFDKISANYKATQAALKRAKEQLSYTVIKAPYSGVVKTRHVEPGEVVAPGRPVMTGLSLKQLRAIADMPQPIANKMAANTAKTNEEKARLVFEKHTIAPASVTVFPYADQQLHSVRIRVTINEDDSAKYNLYPGMWLSMQVQVGERDAILVPETAIIQRSELSAVYVMQNDKVKLRQIRLGQKTTRDGVEYREVSAGLNAGETIAQNGYAVMAQQ